MHSTLEQYMYDAMIMYLLKNDSSCVSQPISLNGDTTAGIYWSEDNYAEFILSFHLCVFLWGPNSGHWGF